MKLWDKKEKEHLSSPICDWSDVKWKQCKNIAIYYHYQMDKTIAFRCNKHKDEYVSMT